MRATIREIVLPALLGLLLVSVVATAGCDRAWKEAEDDSRAGAQAPAGESEAGGGAQETAAETMEETAADVEADLADASITAKVKTKMLAEPSTSALEIDVDTQSGVVALRGNVGSEEAKAAAERIARQTDGVADVVNLLTVGEAEAEEQAEAKGKAGS